MDESIHHVKQDPAQLKQKIMKQYLELGIEQGFSKVLLDQVAAQLSISKKTIYKHFTNKEEIVAACIDDVFAAIDAEVLPIMNDQSISSIEKIRTLPTIVAKHLSFFKSAQVLEIQRDFPQLWHNIVQTREQKIARYETLFRKAQTEGSIIDVAPKIIVHFFLQSIESFTSESFLLANDVSYAQSLKIVSDIMLKGILKDSHFRKELDDEQ